MSRSLFSSDAQLDRLATLIRGYLRLPFSNGLLPGRFVESAVAWVKGGRVLPTYDFVDVVCDESRIGWQVKCALVSTTVTWKRVKLPNATALIESSQNSVSETQELGRRIIDFCNQHAINSLEQYGLSAIGYCRAVVRKADVLYFEREIISQSDPYVFDPASFRWEWSQLTGSTAKEMLPALHGIDERTGEKWFKAHILGENQLHFSGERNWWPHDNEELPSTTITIPARGEMMDFEEFLGRFANNR